MADPIFSARLEDVRSQCEDIANYLLGDVAKTQRPWMVPTNVAGWTFDPVDPTTMNEPFDREDVNQTYKDVLDTKDKGSAAMAAHVQIGYLGMMERAFRQRHRTVTRAYGLTQGRKLGHGDEDHSVHTASVEQYVVDLENL